MFIYCDFYVIILVNTCGFMPGNTPFATDYNIVPVTISLCLPLAVKNFVELPSRIEKV